MHGRTTERHQKQIGAGTHNKDRTIGRQHKRADERNNKENNRQGKTKLNKSTQYRPTENKRHKDAKNGIKQMKSKLCKGQN